MKSFFSKTVRGPWDFTQNMFSTRWTHDRTMMCSCDSQLECNQIHAACISFEWFFDLYFEYVKEATRSHYISKMWGVTEQLWAVAIVCKCVNKTRYHLKQQGCLCSHWLTSFDSTATLTKTTASSRDNLVNWLQRVSWSIIISIALL